MSDKATSKYRAPALEKGLDVLELLATAKSPMTLSQISARLDRSVSELFRMVQVLEARGYVGMSASGEGFELTNKLFSLGISRGPSQNLLASALPLMQTLSDQTRQACHLAIASDDRMVVIARIEAPGDVGFSVRVGYQRPLAHSTSGLLIYAFQKPKIREQWRALLKPGLSPEEWATFEAQAEKALAQGHFSAPSSYIDGITDISCPVINDVGVVAALTMPWIHIEDGIPLDDALVRLKATAKTLSKSLGG
ncbi:IclR family transcriptional regulator [Asticcacaulis taihuensis]|uniref:IclR family transcriptional regulator n=1 Tax=Asticcacaulis taihuensis TaxID=260084 RepID=UPI0026F36888|nr:IclR family transcriptional regulator [Asticcacaulis taihuensis]